MRRVLTLADIDRGFRAPIELPLPKNPSRELLETARESLPAVQTFDFALLEEAQAYRAGLPIDDRCIATITPTPIPKVRQRPAAPDTLGGRMHAVGRKYKP